MFAEVIKPSLPVTIVTAAVHQQCENLEEATVAVKVFILCRFNPIIHFPESNKQNKNGNHLYNVDHSVLLGACELTISQ